MMQRDTTLAFPQALDDDDDDVAWALSTGGVEWKRGAHSDALVWLRRAADSAMESGRRIRAFQLQQQANALQVALETGWLPPAPGSAPAGAGTSDDDGTESLEDDPYGSLAVDIDLPPPETRPPETIDVEAHEVIEDVDDFAEFAGPSSAPGSARSRPPRELELTPIANPIQSEQLLKDLSHDDEATEPDLRPDPLVLPRASRSRARSRVRRSGESSPESQSEPAPRSSGSKRRTQKRVEHVEPEGEQDTMRDGRLDFPSEVSGLTPLESTTLPSAMEPFPIEPISVPPEAVASEPAPTEPALTEPALTEPALTEPLLSAQPPGPPEVGGVLLSTVPGLEDLPDESQAELAGHAEFHTLRPEEEVGGFGLALIIEGSVAVMPAVVDVSATRAGKGELVFSQGHLEEGIAMRVVAGPEGARVASWPPAEFERAIRDSPWVGDELKFVGDRFQALVGVCMGPFGESLDEMLRGLVIGRCEVQRLLPNELIVEGGKPLRGMYVVGAGRIEVVAGSGADAAAREQLGPGDFLFPNAILQASPAPADARAGKAGALVLFAERRVAHELMVSVPPLLEIFAR